MNEKLEEASSAVAVAMGAFRAFNEAEPIRPSANGVSRELYWRNEIAKAIESSAAYLSSLSAMYRSEASPVPSSEASVSGLCSAREAVN